jgi:hypothetical protein
MKVIAEDALYNLGQDLGTTLIKELQHLQIKQENR